MNRKRLEARRARLLPCGVPRYVRCYDAGADQIDRHTVVYTGRFLKKKYSNGALGWPYLGTCGHGASPNQPCDTISLSGSWNRPPAMGHKCYLGRRVPWSSLPPELQRAALSDYCELWSLSSEEPKAS